MRLRKVKKSLHPFSIVKYIVNNKRHFTTINVVIFLGVFLIYLVSMVIQSIENTYYTTTEHHKYYTIIYDLESPIKQSVLDRIKEKPFTEQIIRFSGYSIPMQLNVGGNANSILLALQHEEIDYLMEKMDLKLVEGRLPSTDQYEAVLHKDIAKNLGIKIGDSIGSDYNSNILIPNEYKVVGLLDAKAKVSLAYKEDIVEHCYLIIPKANNLPSLNRYLDELKNDINSSTFIVQTYETEISKVKKIIGSINLLITAISLMVIVIVSACTGFLFYIHYIYRQKDFVLLKILGYKNQEIINQAFIEIALVNSFGYVIGLMLSIICGYIIDRAFFASIGQDLPLLNIDSILISACMPIYATFFSFFPIWHMLKKDNSDNIINFV